MPPSKSAKTATSADPKATAAFLAGVAEPSRVQIVRLLACGEKSVTELSTALGAPLVNTSHHLSVMRAAHVLDSRKDGRSALDSFACEFETTKAEVILKGPGVRVAIER